MQPNYNPRYRQPQRSNAVLIFAVVGAGFVIAVAIVLGFVLARDRRAAVAAEPDPNALAQDRARSAACPDLPTWAACLARQQAEADLKVKKAQAAAAASASASAAAIAELPKLTPAERDAVVRSCAVSAGCSQADMNKVIAAGATQKERDHLELLGFAVTAESMAKKGHDGATPDLAAVLGVSMVVRQEGLKVFDLMSKASVADADKDPDGARGHVVKVSGTVVQIRKVESGSYEGTLATEGGKFIYFITPLATDGVYVGNWAAFRGVFVQEYVYHNAAGGTTASLMLIGGFG